VVVPLEVLELPEVVAVPLLVVVALELPVVVPVPVDVPLVVVVPVVEEVPLDADPPVVLPVLPVVTRPAGGVDEEHAAARSSINERRRVNIGGLR
jgi:hypothetical protein